jgi:Mor family transcriptional regulator
MSRNQRLGDTTAELLLDLTQSVAEQASEQLGIDAEAANQLGREACHALCLAWRGPNHLFFPMGRFLDVQERNLRMFERFDGTNLVDLAQEFGVSQIYAYRIIKCERDRRRALRTTGSVSLDEAQAERPGAETLAQFTATIKCALIKKGGASAAQAEAIALKVRDDIRRRWGGIQIHIGVSAVLPWTHSPLDVGA